MHKIKVRPKYKELLARREKTGKELAEFVGLSQGQVSRIAKGKSWPSFETLWLSAKFLNCKMDDLYEEVD